MEMRQNYEDMWKQTKYHDPENLYKTNVFIFFFKKKATLKVYFPKIENIGILIS